MVTQLNSSNTYEFASPTNSDAVDLGQSSRYSVVAAVTVTTPAATVFTAAVSDICTATAHGFKTGLKGQASTSNALPAGLVALTDYYVIVLTANTFKLASSLSNALAGTPVVDITTTGTGVQTFTPTAIAGASVKLQGSNDSTNTVWVDLSSSTNITATANITWAGASDYLYLRAAYTMTAGQISAVTTTVTKG